MKAEFYGGVLDDEIREVDSCRPFIYAPKFEGTGLSWVQPHLLKTIAPMSVETYRMMVRYPDRLVYVSTQDPAMTVLMLGLKCNDPHVVFFAWREGRLMREVEWNKGAFDLAGLEFLGFVDVMADIAEDRRKRKTLKKRDPK